MSDAPPLAPDALVVPSKRAHDLAARYALVFALRPRGGRLGETLGRAHGASLEFADRRAYLPGDDLRTIDWRAYARSDQVLVRLFTEQISPRVEVVLDLSRSMAVDPSKAQAAVDLTALFLLAARAEGAATRLVCAADTPQDMDLDQLLQHGVRFEARRPLEASFAAASGGLRPGSLRILVSDFLTPLDARSLLQRVADRAGRLVLVQCLSDFEADPEGAAELGPTRLTDVESNQAYDLVLDRVSIQRYRERLRALQDDLRESARRHAGFLGLCAGEAGVDAICAGELVRERVLEPR